MASSTKKALSTLLASANSPGSYCCGGEISNCPIPGVCLVDDETPLQFPLSSEDVQHIKNHASRAGVGLPDRTVVNLDVRKTWQIKPEGLQITEIEPVLSQILTQVQQELGTCTDYTVEASLYKLLLYEEGCFFARHRDNERLDGMFGTLVMELPSDYEGAQVSVWSPTTPAEKQTFANGNDSLRQAGAVKRLRRSARLQRSNNKIKYIAFYSDCHHQVSELTAGHRVVLVYHLTGRPIHPRPTNFHHLPPLPTSPPQPAPQEVAIQIAHLINKLATDPDEDNAESGNDSLLDSIWSDSWGEKIDSWPTHKPQKVVLVLSHHYTPASLTGVGALKGTDRAIAELIQAAAWTHIPTQQPQGPPSLQHLATRVLVEQNPQDYQETSANDFIHSHVEEDYKTSKSNAPNFDAFLSLANLYDQGEMTFDGVGARTTGPLHSVTGAPLPFTTGPPTNDDAQAMYHHSWFGDAEDDFQYWGFRGNREEPDEQLPRGLRFLCGAYHDDWGFPQNAGNHSLPIMNHEILFASDEAYEHHKQYQVKHSQGPSLAVPKKAPKKVEFLGNGMPYPGRVYSRAVIVMWPRAHRSAIQRQTKGGRTIAAVDAS